MTIVTCDSCDHKKIVKRFPNSVPYCSKCGYPISPDGIREATEEEIESMAKPKKTKKASK